MATNRPYTSNIHVLMAIICFVVLTLCAVSVHADDGDTVHQTDRAPGVSRRWVPLLTGLAALLTTGVIKGTDEKDDRASLTNGSLATGILYINGGKLKGKWGTGVALCPNVVLTAGHVADQLTNGLTFAIRSNARERLESGKSKGARATEAFYVRDGKTTKFPRWNAQDIALVKLDRPLVTKGLEFPSLAREVPKQDTGFIVVGYGQKSLTGKFTAPGEAGLRRSGEMSAIKYFRQKGIPEVLLETKPGPEGQLGTSGDSGAPVFLKNRDGSRGEIVGVHSGSRPPGEKGYVAMVSPHYDALTAKLREWCPRGSVP